MIGEFAPGMVDNPIGGYPRDTRVIKVNSEEGDVTPDGSEGTVLKGLAVDPELSIDLPREVKHVYAVEWDSRPGIIINILDYKLAIA